MSVILCFLFSFPSGATGEPRAHHPARVLRQLGLRPQRAGGWGVAVTGMLWGASSSAKHHWEPLEIKFTTLLQVGIKTSNSQGVKMTPLLCVGVDLMVPKQIKPQHSWHNHIPGKLRMKWEVSAGSSKWPASLFSWRGPFWAGVKEVGRMMVPFGWWPGTFCIWP